MSAMNDLNKAEKKAQRLLRTLSLKVPPSEGETPQKSDHRLIELTPGIIEERPMDQCQGLAASNACVSGNKRLELANAVSSFCDSVAVRITSRSIIRFRDSLMQLLCAGLPLELGRFTRRQLSICTLWIQPSTHSEFEVQEEDFLFIERLARCAASLKNSDVCDIISNVVLNIACESICSSDFNDNPLLPLISAVAIARVLRQYCPKSTNSLDQFNMRLLESRLIILVGLTQSVSECDYETSYNWVVRTCSRGFDPTIIASSFFVIASLDRTKPTICSALEFAGWLDCVFEDGCPYNNHDSISFVAGPPAHSIVHDTALPEEIKSVILASQLGTIGLLPSFVTT